MIVWYLLVWVAIFVPLTLSSNDQQHPKMQPGAITNTVIADEYIVVLTPMPLNSTRGNSQQLQRVPSNWFVVKLTEEELRDVLDDDKVAFVEQVRALLRSYNEPTRFSEFLTIFDFFTKNTEYTAAMEQAVIPWGLDRVDQDDLPLSNSYTYGTIYLIIIC